MKALSSNGLKLAHILEDMITQIRSTPALYGLAREATSLADELGFKTPPVEFVELRPPDKHPLLKEHVAGVLVLRIHDRVGRTFAQIDLAVFAPEITLLPQPGDEMIDNARVLLETWKREVDRLGENHTPMQQPARRTAPEVVSGSTGNSLGAAEAEIMAETRTRGRAKRAVVEPRIADHLKKRPHDRVTEVAAAVGCSVGLVCQSNAWKLNQMRLAKAKKQGVDPTAVKMSEADISETLINAAGGNARTQIYDARREQEAIDNEIDRNAELDRLMKEQAEDKTDGEPIGPKRRRRDEARQEWITPTV